MTKISTNKENSFKELTLSAFNFFKQNIKTIFFSLLIFIILPNIISNLFPSREPSVLKFLSFILSSLGSIAFNLIIFNVQKQKTKSIIKILNSKNTLIKFKQLILTGLLLIVMLIGLSFLFVFPAIIYGIYWIFSSFVVIDKDFYGKKALNYSKLLIENQWWKTAFISFLPTLTTLILSFITNIPLDNPLMIVLNAVFFSFTTIILMFKYLNLDQIHNSK